MPTFASRVTRATPPSHCGDIRFGARVHWLVLAACALVAGGCFSKVQLDGFMETQTNEAFERVRSQASFDMQCSPDDIQVKILTIHKVSEIPDTLGVTGCGKRAVYVRPHNSNQWIQNTHTQPAP